MKTFHLLVVFILFLFKKDINAVNIKISLPHNLPVKLGEKVIITCELSKVIENEPPVIFFKRDQILSEGCVAYTKDLYELKCENNQTKYMLTIKNVSWNDKGIFKCMYNSLTKSLNLDIYVPNNVSMTINPIPMKILSVNLGPQSYPMKHESYMMLKGRGTQQFPYDLRKNVTVNVICKSDCGYPAVYHVFNSRNFSNVTSQLTNFQHETKICDKEKNTSSGTSFLTLNCQALKLNGLNNLTCATFHSYYKNDYQLKISEENVFVLCPTEQIKWWKMTYGEIINTAIGCMIGLMLLMFLCLILCRWKSYKHKNNYDSCQEDTGDSKIGRGYRV